MSRFGHSIVMWSQFGWMCVGLCCRFNVWLHSGLAQQAHTHALDFCTVSGWLIKWCDSFWLIWESSGHIHSEKSPLMHAQTHRLTEALITSGKMGLLFIAFVIVAPSPFFSLSFPFSCWLFSGCYLLPSLAYNSSGNLMCVWMMC